MIEIMSPNINNIATEIWNDRYFQIDEQFKDAGLKHNRVFPRVSYCYPLSVTTRRYNHMFYAPKLAAIK